MQTDQLTEQEKALLKRALSNKGIIVCGFTTDTFQVGEDLVRKNLMTQHRNISPWHDAFKLTREGRKIAKNI